jgi:hypothetical protein
LGRKKRFFKKSAQKTFAPLEPWALTATTPTAQSGKSFLVLFFKKEPLALLPETLTIRKNSEA